MSLLKRSLLLMSCLLFSNLAMASDLRGVWSPLAPLPFARQEVGVTVLDEEVYVLGGLVPGGATAALAIFEPATNTWRAGPMMPQALHHVGAAAIGSRVYSVGGFFGFTFSAVSLLLELNPETGQWIQRAPLPQARGALAVAVIDDLLYAVGGTSGGADTAVLSVYSPASDQWTTLPDMPTPRNHHAAVAVNGELYVVGGRRGSSNLGTLEIYDPVSQQWRSGTPMPTPRSGIAAVESQGLIFVFGGEIPGVFDETEVYDPATDSWFSLAPMRLPRHGIGAALVGNRIIIPGGATLEGLGATSATDQFVLLNRQMVLAQVADGPAIFSELLINNYGTATETFLVEFRDDPGDLLALPLGSISAAQVSGTVAPHETFRLRSSSTSLPTVTGSALLFAERPLPANLLFLSDFGFAGVRGTPELEAFGVPVQIDEASALDSGVALANPSRTPVVIDLQLRDSEGALLAEAQLQLPPFGHIALFLTQLFPELELDPVLGALTGQASGPIAAMALLFRGAQIATLPVEALNR